MSGGSYNYLCSMDADELLNGEHDLKEMSDRLAGLGYARDAAQETMGVLLEVRACKNRLDAASDRLKGVWRAIEWWDSCDSGEEGVKTALDKYRGK